MSEGNTFQIDAEVFCQGEHRGKEYSAKDMNDIAKNFNLFSVPKDGRNALMNVPGVFGHEEDQEALESSGLAAAAWVKRLRVENRAGKDGIVRPTLIASMGEMPANVASALRNKRYRTISAEVYDKPPKECKGGSGMMLRRVAFLGGDIPQVKAIDDIPDPVPEPHHERRSFPTVLRFSEVRASKTAKTYWIFSEVSAMHPRQHYMDELQKKGFDTSKVTNAVPDDMLAEMCRVHDDAMGVGMEENGKEVPPTPPKDDLEKKAYAEKFKRFTASAKRFASYADEPPPFPTKKEETPEEKKKREEEEAASKAGKFSEASIQKMIDDRVNAAVKKFSEGALGDLNRKGIEAFCETELKAGRLTRAQIEKSNPLNVVDEMLRLDAVTPVVKFSEGGKTVELTALEARKMAIKKGPVIWKNSEYSGSTGAPTEPKINSKEGRKAWATDNYQKFSEHFEKVGMKEAEYVGILEKSNDEQFANEVKNWEQK